MHQLSERFLAPESWRTGTFTNPQTGHKLHYGFCTPQSPKAIVVCLGGLSEFSEKYYETAHDMMDRGYAFWFLDWHYQGRSGRLPDFPMRRHSDGFTQDISDLHMFITDHIQPAVDTHGLPLVMLGHSMGGNIGLRYLAQYPDMFKAAAFTAPLLGIYNFKAPLKLLAMLVRLALPMIGKNYVFAGRDWHEDMRAGDGKGMFSSNVQRDIIHKHWSETEKDLQVGSVTFKWVIEALKSCAILLKPGTAKSINIPVLIATAGEDKIVDNNLTQLFSSRLPQGKFMTINGAEHEILMEDNAYRDAFLEAFDKLIEDAKITPSQQSTANQENTMQGFTKNKERISDRILYALELAIEQKDLELAESLNHCLDIAMTRNSGGGEFVERRDYPQAIEEALRDLRQLKIKQ